MRNSIRNMEIDDFVASCFQFRLRLRSFFVASFNTDHLLIINTNKTKNLKDKTREANKKTMCQRFHLCSRSQRFQTASMSIHRLKRDLPCPESGSNPDPSRFLSSLLSHLDGNCSMSTLSLLDRARDLKWKLEDLQRWITHMSQQEHETVKKRLKAMFGRSIDSFGPQEPL